MQTCWLCYNLQHIGILSCVGEIWGGILLKALKMSVKKNENKLVAILSGGRAQPVLCAKLQPRAFIFGRNEIINHLHFDY